MTAQSSRNPTPGAGRRLAPLRLAPLRLVAGAWSTHRTVLIGYGQLLAGAGGRLALQMIYFLVLANTLSLAEMGVFASVSAAGVMIGCLAGFGFQSFVMRSAAGRRSSMGGYLAVYYACFGLALPIMLGLSLALYVLLFRNVIALPGYLAIIVVEVALWRQIELLVQVNNGLGRYAAAATVVSLPVGFRAAAAVAFWAAGGGDAETWALYYLVGNAVSVTVLAFLFHPRTRMRFRAVLLKGRLRDGLLYAASYFMFLAQGEIDKLIVLTLAGERMAGIYAISMRLIDLTGVPLRPMFMMYSRKLIQAGRATRASLRECLKVEAMVACVSTGALAFMVAVLHIRPDLLGPNVSAAYGMLTVIVAVPAVRNLLEFQGELFFAFGRMGLRAGVTAALIAFKAAAFVLLLTAFPDPAQWSLWLNAIYVAIYAFSFLTLYGLLWRNTAP
ncbi:lipopolysaccharide biosynthesis protein [Methylobacterium bullatum]|uniref:Uncharacterized protein n=1 Tax=Methylobacterium bullatum TaxID=570505 RepID=A0A679K8U7_9HYPH|nr:hypothetical protein MBLL_03503 [Methylobacterium bullatum]